MHTNGNDESTKRQAFAILKDKLVCFDTNHFTDDVTNTFDPYRFKICDKTFWRVRFRFPFLGMSQAMCPKDGLFRKSCEIV